MGFSNTVCYCVFDKFAYWSIFGVNSDNIYVNTSAQMLSTIITLPLSFGATAYVMKFVRGEECDIKGMFQYYKIFGPIFGVWF